MKLFCPILISSKSYRMSVRTSSENANEDETKGEENLASGGDPLDDEFIDFRC